MAQNEEYVKRSIQIPESIDRLWTAAARQTGVNKTAALINALRAYAKAEGVTVPPQEEVKAS
jgi:hypothetical protein